MIYLANPSTPSVRAAMVSNPWLGAMVTPAQGNSVDPSISVGVDNGCFARPEAFDARKFVSKIEAFPPDQVLFVNSPDALGDWGATVMRAGIWLPLIAEMGYPPAIVLQDGATPETFPPFLWGIVEAVFIGGTTPYKMGEDAALLAIESRRRGKWVHMGRVNSLKRLRYADSIGCHSADGTYVTFGPDKNLPKVLSWLADVNRTPSAGRDVASLTQCVLP